MFKYENITEGNIFNAVEWLQDFGPWKKGWWATKIRIQGSRIEEIRRGKVIKIFEIPHHKQLKEFLNSGVASPAFLEELERNKELKALVEFDFRNDKMMNDFMKSPHLEDICKCGHPLNVHISNEGCCTQCKCLGWEE